MLIFACIQILSFLQKLYLDLVFFHVKYKVVGNGIDSLKGFNTSEIIFWDFLVFKHSYALLILGESSKWSGAWTNVIYQFSHSLLAHSRLAPMDEH